MKLHAGDSRRSLSALTKSIKNLTLTDRGGATASPGQAVLLARGAPTSFPRFFDLPPEIRLLVYEQYFADSGLAGGTLIAPKSHPRTKHATALLLVSKTVFEEALPLLYAKGTMTIDLNPRFHKNKKDYAYFLDHIITPGSSFAGSTSQLLRMTNIHLTLGPPPPRSHALRLPGQMDPLKYWQYILPIFVTTSKMFPSYSLSLYLGDITTILPAPAAGIRYRPLTFASYVSRNRLRDFSWKQPLIGPKETSAERLARAPGKRLKTKSRAWREVNALATLVIAMGMKAEMSGIEILLENHDRTRKRVLDSGKLTDLVETARELVGHKEVNGVWLVTGDKKKSELKEGGEADQL